MKKSIKLGKESSPVVCGTDFSTAAEGACHVAANLAKRMGEPLVVLHVHNPSKDWLSRDTKQVRKRLHERLHGDAERFRKEHGLVVHPVLLIGLPDELLCDFSLLSKAKLIVLSALGERSAVKWLLGSVAERVAQQTSVPLLIIRRREPFAAAFRGKVLKVVAATDFSLSSDVALDWFKNLGQVVRTDLLAVHVATTNAVNQEQLLTRRIRAHVKRNPFKVIIVAGPNDPSATLLKITRDESAGLILTGTHQRAGLDRFWYGSISDRILHDRSCNLLIIPHRRRKPKMAAGHRLSSRR